MTADTPPQKRRPHPTDDIAWMKHVGSRVHHPIKLENNQKYASAHTLTHVLASPLCIVFTSDSLIRLAQHHELADR